MRWGKMEVALKLALSPINFMNSMFPTNDLSGQKPS